MPFTARTVHNTRVQVNGRVGDAAIPQSVLRDWRKNHRKRPVSVLFADGPREEVAAGSIREVTVAQSKGQKQKRQRKSERLQRDSVQASTVPEAAAATAHPGAQSEDSGRESNADNATDDAASEAGSETVPEVV